MQARQKRGLWNRAAAPGLGWRPESVQDGREGVGSEEGRRRPGRGEAGKKGGGRPQSCQRCAGAAQAQISAASASEGLEILRTFWTRPDFLLLVVRTQPPSAAASRPTDFALDSAEYFHVFRPVRLFGSLENSAPDLPSPLLLVERCFMRKHEVSRVIAHTSSELQFARVVGMAERSCVACQVG